MSTIINGGYGNLGRVIPTTSSANGGYTFKAAQPDITQWHHPKETNAQLDYLKESGALSGKAWDLYYNEPTYRAIVESLQSLVFGADGLWFRSDYTNPNVDEVQSRFIRRQIEASILSASSGTRLDAGNQVTRLQLERAIDLGSFNNGDGFGVRVTKDRKHDEWKTTIRVLDAWRVRNPPDVIDFDPQDDGNWFFQGIEYTKDGEPFKLHYVKDPNAILTAGATINKDSYDSVEWFDSETGTPNVIHRFSPGKANQLRGFCEAAPLLKQSKYLNSINESYLTAKAAQSNDVKIIEAGDIAIYDAAQKAQATLGPNSPSNKGNVYYISPGSKYHAPDINFSGADYKEFVNVHLRSWCAMLRIPYKFAMASFDSLSMASSRSEFDMAERTGRARQDIHIAQCSRIIDTWILEEAIARGRVRIQSLRNAMRGNYKRPATWSNDPGRDAKADTERLNQGVSFDTIYSRRGWDFEEQARRRADEEVLLDDLGIKLTAVIDEEEEPEEPEPNPRGKNAMNASVTLAQDEEGNVYRIKGDEVDRL